MEIKQDCNKQLRLIFTLIEHNTRINDVRLDFDRKAPRMLGWLPLSLIRLCMSSRDRHQLSDATAFRFDSFSFPPRSNSFSIRREAGASETERRAKRTKQRETKID